MSLNLSLHKEFFNCVELLNVLGTETRLKILKLLTSGKEFTISELANSLECGIANVSQQIQILKDAGLISVVKMKDGTMRKFIMPVYKKVIIEL